MSGRPNGPRSRKTPADDERAFLTGSLATVAISPEFAEALKAAFDIDTVEELIRFEWHAAPTQFGPGYTREDLFTARETAKFYLEGRRGRVVTSSPIDPVDNEIASHVTSMILVDEELQQVRRRNEMIDALETAAHAARDLAFELKRYSHQVQGVWPPWATDDAETASPQTSRPPTGGDSLPTMLRLMLPGIAQRLTPKANELQRRLADNLKKKYRATVTVLRWAPEGVLLRSALRLSDGQPLPDDPPLSADADSQAVEALALALSSVALALAVEVAQFPSAEELAQHRHGAVGSIPKAPHWADLERWRKSRGITYYRIAKVIMAWPAIRSHFDPDCDLDLTVEKVEKRLRRFLSRSGR